MTAIDIATRFPRTSLRDAYERWVNSTQCAWHRSCEDPRIEGGRHCPKHAESFKKIQKRESRDDVP